MRVRIRVRVRVRVRVGVRFRVSVMGRVGDRVVNLRAVTGN